MHGVNYEKFIYIYIIQFADFKLQRKRRCRSEKNHCITDQKTDLKIATFAGGCFWCVESDFEKVPGVVKVISGYTGGSGENPTYENYQHLGYVEAVQIFLIRQLFHTGSLLIIYGNILIPQTQGDSLLTGDLHTEAKFFITMKNREKIAEKSKADLINQNVLINRLLQIVKFKNFSSAEDYHQDYYKKNPVRYKYYRNGSGRDQFLDKVWGDERDKIKPLRIRNTKNRRMQS